MIMRIDSKISHIMFLHDYRLVCEISMVRTLALNRARKSRTTLKNEVRLKVLPEQLALFVNTSVTFKNCIIQ